MGLVGVISRLEEPIKSEYGDFGGEIAALRLPQYIFPNIGAGAGFQALVSSPEMYVSAINVRDFSELFVRLTSY